MRTFFGSHFLVPSDTPPRASFSPPYHKMRQKILPSEGFLDKGIRLANSATSLIGSAKGIYEAGRYVYSGLQAARPLLALM